MVKCPWQVRLAWKRKIMARILFVDDDPITLKMMRKAAELFNHQALLASNGQEALDTAVAELPDLIFTDMFLPDFDGIALIQRLRGHAATQNIPIFVLSASSADNEVERAQAAGAQGYLDKPIRLQQLQEIIQQHAP
jgi:CheY-like chemotaxis protein